MEQEQLLQDGSVFADCLVIRKLSNRHNGEREVYLVKSSREVNDRLPEEPDHCGVLTVFNLKSNRYKIEGSARKRTPDFIEEVRFLRSRPTSAHFAKVVDFGIERSGKLRLGWMLQHTLEAKTLKSEILLQNGLCAADTHKIMDRLFSAVDEIARFTQNGGHYNITPDNILLEYDGDDLREVYLVGLTDMGSSHFGSPPFGEQPYGNRHRAPESANGVYNHLSDIYSLGIVMTMMITGDIGEYAEPVSDADGDPPKRRLAELGKQLLERNHGKLSASQRLVLEKATEANPSKRFQNIGRFRSFVDKLAKGMPAASSHMELSAAATAIAGGLSHSGEEHLPGRIEHETGQNEKFSKTTKNESSKGLDDVAGMSELKDLFRRDFIRIVRNPKVAEAYGIKPGNCTLLYGPQGCGKTFIAEKAAQESGLNYRIVNPAELGSIYIHGSQQKIAELFEEAEKKGPTILIFDEFDAIVPRRDSESNSNQANEVNEMLTQLNNCASRGVYVLATTNRPTLLDPAVMRKGRVDRTVFVSLPDSDARKELFRLEIEKRPFEEIDYDFLVAATDNYTCSDISYIVEESARRCFEETLDRGLDTPLPLSTGRLMEVIGRTLPSVSETQRKEYLEMKTKMESRQPSTDRKKVGFTL